MLDRIKNFFQTTLLGGIAIILPISIMVFVFRWLFGVVSEGIKPMTTLVVNWFPMPKQYDELIAKLIVVIIILGGCFLVGLLIKTKFGQFIFNSFETGFLRKTPGYKMIKETVNQFFSRKSSPFSSVALIQIFQNETFVTGFITDTHENDMVSVFVPTGPNPTSGFIYHLPKKYVHKVDVPIEDAMRSVISCGTGSNMLIKKMHPENI